MPRPPLIVSQSDYLIQVLATNSHTEWQTMQIQISWLKKPTDLDLHSLQRQSISRISRTRFTLSIQTNKPEQTVLTQIRLDVRDRMQHLIRVATVCHWSRSFYTHFNIALGKTFFSTKKYLYFSYFLKKTCCGYSLEVPWRGASNEYPQHMFLSRNKKNINLLPTLI